MEQEGANGSLRRKDLITEPESRSNKGAYKDDGREIKTVIRRDELALPFLEGFPRTKI